MPDARYFNFRHVAHVEGLPRDDNDVNWALGHLLQRPVPSRFELRRHQPIAWVDQLILLNGSLSFVLDLTQLTSQGTGALILLAIAIHGVVGYVRSSKPKSYHDSIMPTKHFDMERTVIKPPKKDSTNAPP